MCNRLGHRHSIFCFLPPYILLSVAENGTREEVRAAVQTLATDTTMRALRVLQSPRQEAVQVRRAPLTGEGEKRRSIYNADGTQSLPGTLVRIEGSPPSGDPAVDEAYDGLGRTFDFYWEAYARNSIDDEGQALVGTVHFGRSYSNAFWNGEQMVFGDGDGRLFNRFTMSLDVIGHELTHGVVEDEARLVYMFQSGALNESMADVFGSLIRQYALNQAANEADWLIGAGLFTSRVQGVALRSMKAPGTAFDDAVLGKDPQPAHMRNFMRTMEDNGGVHINSGIPNHAFYLAATNLGGYAWKQAGRIWYETLKDPQLRPNTGFRRFAKLTVNNAARLYGRTSAEQQAVREAWAQVGIRAS